MIATRKSGAGARFLRAHNLRRGLGAGTVHGVELETCNSGNIPADLACSERNRIAVAESYGESPVNYVDSNTAGWMNLTGPWISTAQRMTLAAAARTTTTPPPGASAPRVVFTNSRGGSTLYPGDTWTVRITGAAPNAEVRVTGGKNGAVDTNRMGTTDAAGSFTLSGVVSSEELGNWAETWTAGGVNTGSFSFSVVSGPGGTTGGGSGSGTGGGATPPPSSNSSTWFTEEIISGIPNWMLIAGAGAFFIFGGKH